MFDLKNTIILRLSLLFWLVLLNFWDVSALKAQTPDQPPGQYQMHQTPPRLIGLSSLPSAEQTDHVIGIEFNLKPDWKLYWRTPGSAGLPPVLNWQEDSLNLTQAELQFPIPERLELLGLTTFGYGGRVVFPLELTLNQAGLPTKLAGTLDYLICHEICIPTNFAFDDYLGITQKGSDPNAERLRLAKALATVPQRIDPPFDETHALQIRDLALHSIKAEGDQSLYRWRIGLTADSLLPFHSSSDLLIEIDGNNEPWPQPVRSMNAEGTARWIAETVLDHPPNPQETITLTLINGQQAFEINQPIANLLTDAPITSLEPTGSFLILTMVGLALLGGLILNLMPCVLPVLSLKLIGLLSHQPHSARKSLMAVAAGIIFAFWLLAIGVIALKLSGQALGWGIQFQSPIFLMLLAVVMVLFSANLMGMWQFSLPQGLVSRLPQTSAHLSGQFLSGMFATLLATPCTAPFLGTAIGFALAGSIAEIMLIFTGLGIGMASPYLLLAIWPKALSFLPRSGQWMVRVKQIMGLLLIATLIWLLSILKLQLLPWLFWGIVLGFIAIYGLFLLKPLRKFAAFAAILLIVTPVFNQTVPSPKLDRNRTITWQNFDETQIAKLVAEDKIVFVNITAEWCITCKVNEVTVLENTQITDMIAQIQPVMMEGDWTNPDPLIAQYLHKHGRYGIPFNAIYSKRHPQGLLLPELLTITNVEAALNSS